jgi:hypothetical protein
MPKTNALGYFSDRSVPTVKHVAYGGGSNQATTTDVEAGGSSSQVVKKYDSNQILCISLTSILILFGIGVSTWYAIEQANQQVQ